MTDGAYGNQTVTDEGSEKTYLISTGAYHTESPYSARCLHVGPAARFVKNCCEREPGTVTNLLNDLKWNSVELRRKIARLATMYKKVNNKTKVNIPETLKEWNTLPSFLLDQPSMDAFKSAVTNYFNLPH
ncbi:unnamed protein product [Porites evermanni]|uniref:Uncharacterized protein n=1 Tax=Porites evermanni TaxID=104178 RepID=A0ABN8SF31_9CNID|nr:unnamed protein product [Porites evermanni]